MTSFRVFACVVASGGGCGGAAQPTTVTAPVTSVATSQPQPPTARPAPAPSGTLAIGRGDFGTAHPTIVRRSDPGERWMSLCQARADTDGDGAIAVHTGHHGEMFGDTMAQYLVLGGGEGTPIDSLVSVSADSRWLAIVRGENLELVDTTTGALFALADADLESDHRPGAPHRAAMFAGNRLLFIRHRAQTDALVIHDPATHQEREIEITDRLWRIASADGLAHIFTVAQGGGFPQLRTSLAAGECLGPPMSYSTGGQQGATPTERWIDLDQGTEVAVDGLVASIGTTRVRTPASGALDLDSDEIAPPACKAQVLALVPSPPRVIAICGVKKQAKVLLLGKGLRVELAAIDRDKDHYGDHTDALGPATGVVCDAGLHCVTTATSQRIDLKGGVAQHAYGNKLYVVHATTSKRTFEILDVVTGTRTPIKSDDKKLATGKFIIDYSDQLIDLEQGTILGKVTDPMRLSTAGRVLKLAGKDVGPVRWTGP
ncbi:MAG: hypothetical protein WKG01_35280 [Kofleriaceae bacterium]